MTLKPQANTIIEKVAAYVRVSTEEQKLFGLSLDAQREKLQEYAQEHNLQIVDWYEDEGVSGRKLIRKRPELQRMLNDAQTGKFTRIIFIKLDRYFRSVAEYYECQKILESHNVTWTATTEKFDLTTANGRYWVTQKLAMAEFEADQTSERIKLINEYKAKTGQAMSGSHCQGFGHTVETIDGVKRVVKNKETEAATMAFIEHFLKYQNITHAIDHVRINFGIHISFTTAQKLLKNPKICGEYRGNKEYCEKYIDRETFDLIQTYLARNIRTTSKRRIYLFTGLIPCPKCGRVMGGSFNGSQTNIKKSGKVYKYNREYYSYRCCNAYIEKKCDFTKRPNETKLENQLLDIFDSSVKEYVEVAKIEDARRKDDTVIKKIESVKGEMNRLNTMYLKQRITESQYDATYTKLEAELAELEKRMEPIVERDLARYETLCTEDWKDLYNALTKENKRAFWRKYIKSICLNDNSEIEGIIFF